MGASYNKTVEFSSGRGAANFPVFKSTGALASAQAKATVLMTVAMAVIQQMEHAVVACDKKKTKCTDANATCPHDPTPYIDSAVAFYAGSLQGDDGSGEGKMYFDATNRMALRFATCGESGNDDVGEAWVNGMVIREFQKAQQNLMHGSCALARKSKEHIVNMMKVPLVQGVLQYAHKRQFEASTNHEVAEQEVAEGATFAAALLPYLHACNAQDAEVVYENLQVTASSVNFAQVKGALERNYGCLGVTCESVGGVWTVNGYAQGASPCVTQPTGASSPGGIAALTIGTICSLGLIGFLYLRYRQRKLRKDRQRTSNIAAVSEIA
jgi:Low iron-inducible periplasmic protein